MSDLIIEIKDHVDSRGVKYYTVHELLGIRKGEMYWYDWEDKFYSWYAANRARQDAINKYLRDDKNKLKGIRIT
jgi:hypothetical protein